MRTITQIKELIRENLFKGKHITQQIKEIRENMLIEPAVKEELLCWLQNSPCVESAMAVQGDISDMKI